MSGTTYVYRIVVTKPVGSEKPGWEPENWYEVCERLGWIGHYGDGPGDAPPFRWPARRSFLSRSAAERRANHLREFGATVEVVRSEPVVFSEEPSA